MKYLLAAPGGVAALCLVGDHPTLRRLLALILGALGNGVGVGDAALGLALVPRQVVLVVLGELVAG
jgi:hypothetical protein